MRFWIVLSFLLVGCANKDQKCGSKFLALWPNEQGSYSFQEIRIPSLTNPYEMSGPAAKIYVESGIGGKGFRGPVARPRFTRTGDTCVPMDVQSSSAVSLYAQFERLKNFDDKIGVSGYLTWPRKVGLDIHLIASNGRAHNNAHYFGAGDGIAVVPYTAGLLPMGENHGVIAHEHFHAYFQRMVNQNLNVSLASSLPDLEALFYPGFKATVEDTENVDIGSIRGLNGFVLRAWNEGLADLYGAIYTRNPRFVDDSLEGMKGSRSLDSPMQPLMNRFGLTHVAQQVLRPMELVDYSYQQGALLSRILFRIAMSGAESPEEFIKRVIDRLNDIAPAIAFNYDKQVMNFEDILPILLKDYPIKASTCREMANILSKELISGGLPQCSTAR